MVEFYVSIIGGIVFFLSKPKLQKLAWIAETANSLTYGLGVEY